MGVPSLAMSARAKEAEARRSVGRVVGVSALLVKGEPARPPSSRRGRSVLSILFDLDLFAYFRCYFLQKSLSCVPGFCFFGMELGVM